MPKRYRVIRVRRTSSNTIQQPVVTMIQPKRTAGIPVKSNSFAIFNPAKVIGM